MGLVNASDKCERRSSASLALKVRNFSCEGVRNLKFADSVANMWPQTSGKFYLN